MALKFKASRSSFKLSLQKLGFWRTPLYTRAVSQRTLMEPELADLAPLLSGREVDSATLITMKPKSKMTRPMEILTWCLIQKPSKQSALKLARVVNMTKLRLLEVVELLSSLTALSSRDQVGNCQQMPSPSKTLKEKPTACMVALAAISTSAQKTNLRTIR